MRTPASFPLKIGSLLLSGAGSDQFNIQLPDQPANTTGFVLQGGQSQVVTIQFTAQNTSAIDTELMFYENDAAVADPVIIPVTATTISNPAILVAQPAAAPASPSSTVYLTAKQKRLAKKLAQKLARQAAKLAKAEKLAAKNHA